MLNTDEEKNNFIHWVALVFCCLMLLAFKYYWAQPKSICNACQRSNWEERAEVCLKNECKLSADRTHWDCETWALNEKCERKKLLGTEQITVRLPEEMPENLKD